jgi:ABC-type branched-subunit amino acid transport system ATPase component
MSIEALIKNAKFTVLLGKNGAGKSTQLRTLITPGSLNTKYISPERGGKLKYDGNVDTNISNNPTWLDQSRLQNRFELFREQSAVQFRNLEILVLREIEQDLSKRNNLSYTFDQILEKINNLLPHIKLIRSDRGFSIQSKLDQPINEEQISSGESELIALAIEVLVFSRSQSIEKVLLLDEPDVHLHPDLQQKFIGFVESVAIESEMRVVIATHSTAIIGAFSQNSDLQIIPVENREQTNFLEFKRSRICEEILPIFGAHPLSNVFNLSSVVLLEGEDDKRVFEQAIRSSNDRFKFSFCVVGTVSEQNKWEIWLNQSLPVLYDNPKAFSLRDLDDSPQTDIEDLGVVCRVRLNCYAVENLLLSDQCFTKHHFSPNSFKDQLEKWLEQYPGHVFSDEVKDLTIHFDDRRTRKIKNLRNIIVALLGSNKPWEVVVGQLIASNVSESDVSQHSIQTYLGNKVINELFS